MRGAVRARIRTHRFGGGSRDRLGAYPVAVAQIGKQGRDRSETRPRVAAGVVDPRAMRPPVPPVKDDRATLH